MVLERLVPEFRVSASLFKQSLYDRPHHGIVHDVLHERIARRVLKIIPRFHEKWIDPTARCCIQYRIKWEGSHAGALEHHHGRGGV